MDKNGTVYVISLEAMIISNPEFAIIDVKMLSDNTWVINAKLLIQSRGYLVKKKCFQLETKEFNIAAI